MDQRGGDQIRSVGGVIAVEIRAVLEVVRIERLVGQRLIGQHIIVVYYDLKRVARLGERRFDLLKDLRMGWELAPTVMVLSAADLPALAQPASKRTSNSVNRTDTAFFMGDLFLYNNIGVSWL